MFTTTDCNCHNLTMLFTLLSKPIVLSLQYLQDMNGLLIVFYKWLTKQDWECEWNQGKGWVATRCVKGVVFTDGWCVVYIVKGCQNFKNGPLWGPPGSPPPRSLPWPLALHAVNERSMKISYPMHCGTVCKLRKKIWASAGCPVHEIWTSAKDFGYP